MRPPSSQEQEINLLELVESLGLAEIDFENVWYRSYCRVSYRLQHS